MRQRVTVPVWPHYLRLLLFGYLIEHALSQLLFGNPGWLQAGVFAFLVLASLYMLAVEVEILRIRRMQNLLKRALVPIDEAIHKEE